MVCTAMHRTGASYEKAQFIAMLVCRVRRADTRRKRNEKQMNVTRKWQGDLSTYTAPVLGAWRTGCETSEVPTRAPLHYIPSRERSNRPAIFCLQPRIRNALGVCGKRIGGGVTVSGAICLFAIERQNWPPQRATGELGEVLK